MRDWLTKTEVIIAIVVGLVGVGSGVWALEKHWNESNEIMDVRFCAYSNKEMYLKMKLDELCRKYGKKRYPCSNAGMNEDDTVDFNQYEKWYREQQKQIQGMFRG